MFDIMWKHLRDVYAWFSVQPRLLSAQHLKSITVLHRVRIYRVRGGGLVIQAKRWLTDGEWQAPVPPCSGEEMQALRALRLTIVQPAWLRL